MAKLRRIAGVWEIAFDDTDQSLGEITYAASETLKINATAATTTGLAMTLSTTPGGDPVAEFLPAAVVVGTGQFRIPDSALAPHVEEGESAYINFWTGAESDPTRRGYGALRRKPSIRRTTAPGPAAAAVAFGAISGMALAEWSVGGIGASVALTGQSGMTAIAVASSAAAGVVAISAQSGMTAIASASAAAGVVAISAQSGMDIAAAPSTGVMAPPVAISARAHMEASRPPPPPELVVSADSDSEWTIAGITADSFDVVIVAGPPEYAGTYTVLLADTATGPVNVVRPFLIFPDLAVGTIVTVDGGVWVGDEANGPLTLTEHVDTSPDGSTWTSQGASFEITEGIADGTFSLRARVVGADDGADDREATSVDTPTIPDAQTAWAAPEVVSVGDGSVTLSSGGGDVPSAPTIIDTGDGAVTISAA